MSTKFRNVIRNDLVADLSNGTRIWLYPMGRVGNLISNGGRMRNG